eukprot:SAG11_NODE_53_length_19648_cov_14.691902_3_plen_213_part_00
MRQYHASASDLSAETGGERLKSGEALVLVQELAALTSCAGDMLRHGANSAAAKSAGGGGGCGDLCVGELLVQLLESVRFCIGAVMGASGGVDGCLAVNSSGSRVDELPALLLHADVLVAALRLGCFLLKLLDSSFRPWLLPGGRLGDARHLMEAEVVGPLRVRLEAALAGLTRMTQDNGATNGSGDGMVVARRGVLLLSMALDALEPELQKT